MVVLMQKLTDYTLQKDINMLSILRMILDKSTNSIKVVDYAHNEIHNGDHYCFYDYDTDVDTGAPKYYRITTPDTTRWCHMIFELYSEGLGTWELFENPTVNAAGTPATLYNNNRNSANTAGLVIAPDATSTADGTRIGIWRTGQSTGGANRGPSSSRNDVEFILKQNEDYFLKFTADADNSKTKLGICWYEHINRI